jgi:hypothetical protein
MSLHTHMQTRHWLRASGFSELRSYGGGVGRNYSDASEGSAGGSFTVGGPTTKTLERIPLIWTISYNL